MVLFHYVIRLKRGGHKHHPIYHIVSILKYKRSSATYLQKLGFLDLTTKQHILFLNLRKLGTSLNSGAVLNLSVKKYISKFIL